MRIQIPENWFYTNEPVRMPGDGERYAYHLVPGRDPRPGNFEDELVSDFLADTDQPEWAVDDVEGHLRIALRRATDAAVRTTLDAEGRGGVVYESAEERAADTKEILRHLDEFVARVALFALKTALAMNDEVVAESVNNLSRAASRIHEAITGQQEAS
jgi:hypothetical protein